MQIEPTPTLESNPPKTQNLGVQGDFETFLRMLTTQIQNQDPLSPMESEAFASQLAQFSMVEQQTLANQKLNSLVDALANSQAFSSANMIGRQVLHTDSFQFLGAPIEFEVEDPLNSDTKLIISDQNGRTVRELDGTGGAHKLIWDGLSNEGATLEIGQYSAQLQSSSDAQPLHVPVFTSGSVEEVRFGEGAPELLLSDGTIIPETSIARLR
ncbi:flagellar hook assembly protein FlgD [Marivita sp. S0852]|uniref:flagellar hook assembly protein FlgD n=1 Tax=Marivita sp. S0852 TaxID=3373893 RepID=UPI003981AD37